MPLGLRIPFTGLQRQYKQLRNEILDVTDQVLSSGQLMNGKYTREFEEWLAKANNVEYAVTCHSGTHALEILAEFWEIEHVRKPPCVLIPSLTYVATANAFIRAGWDIHFIDTNKYGMFDTTKIPHNLDYQAVVLVGLYGAGLVDSMDLGLWSEWNRRGIIVIEDAAQHWIGNNFLRTGDCTAISFDPMKNLSSYGNGGAIVTDQGDLAKFAKSWCNNGNPRHDMVGTNSRMSELDCASLLVKTGYLTEWQSRRANISKHYIERFKDSNLRCLIDDTNADGHANHKFVIEVDDRDLLQHTLKSAGIETKIHYEKPLHELSVYRQYPGPDILSASSSLSRRCLSLPIYPELQDSEVDFIADQVLSFV
jgi:dTDP-4-amino-4,6-dideoxygalactose transaminase